MSPTWSRTFPLSDGEQPLSQIPNRPFSPISARHRLLSYSTQARASEKSIKPFSLRCTSLRQSQIVMSTALRSPISESSIGAVPISSLPASLDESDSTLLPVLRAHCPHPLHPKVLTLIDGVRRVKLCTSLLLCQSLSGVVEKVRE